MGPNVIVAVACGVVFLLILLALAVWLTILDRDPPPMAQVIFRGVLALAAGGFAAALTGTLDLKFASGPFTLQATAGIAFAVLIYLVNPPEQAAKAARSRRGIGTIEERNKPPKASPNDTGTQPE